MPKPKKEAKPIDERGALKQIGVWLRENAQKDIKRKLFEINQMLEEKKEGQISLSNLFCILEEVFLDDEKLQEEVIKRFRKQKG
jgi:hypothetical protein